MILNRKDRIFFVPEGLHRPVIQIDLSHLHIGGQRFRINGKAVILSGDQNFAGLQIFDRLIGAAMPEF